MQKTIKEWLETLPEPYRSKALKNHAENPFEFDGVLNISSVGDALANAFSWSSTEDGHDYWSSVCSGSHPFSNEPFTLASEEEPRTYVVLPEDELPEPPISELKSNWPTPQPVSDFPTGEPSETYATDGTIMSEGVLKHVSEGLNQEEAIEADALDRTFEKIRQRLDSDSVNHPSHYTKGDIECIDALAAATIDLTGMEAVCTANAIKYLWRWKQKNGVEDLKKAKFYIDKLINSGTQKA